MVGSGFCAKLALVDYVGTYYSKTMYNECL